MSGPSDWDRLASDYAARFGLMPAEQELVHRLAERLSDAELLDIGIGAGRTTEILAPLVSAYVGIDYSARMIEAARARVPRDVDATLHVADARDLSRWHNHDFDIVLFSFNGIDAVDAGDRVRILREVREVIGIDGIFSFSTHSLHALPLSARPRRPSRGEPLRSTLRSLHRAARLAAVNRRLDLEAARARGWARVRDGAHGFSLVLTYVDPTYQLRQLEECGFSVVDVLDSAGHRIDPQDPGREAHLFYICRPQRDNRSP